MKCRIRKPYLHWLPFGVRLSVRSKKWLTVWASLLLTAITLIALVIVDELKYGLAANLYGNFYISVIHGRPFKLRGSLPGGTFTLHEAASLAKLRFREVEEDWNRCDCQPES